MPGYRRIQIGNGGWMRVELLDGGIAYVRAAPASDGKLEVVELYVEGHLTTDVLRSVPLGQITAACNSPGVEEAIRGRLKIPGPDLRRLVSFFATTFGPQARHWVAESMRAQFADSTVEQPAVSDDTPLQQTAPLPAKVRKSRRVLKAPPRKPYPDSFYEKVADQYLAASAETSSPAVVLAKRAGVPTTTVHGWVQEARRRGLLTRGRRE